MLAVLLACASALLFGALAVAIRIALQREADPELGALASAAVALVLCGTAAGLGSGGAELQDLTKFFLAGTIAPGVTQIMFFRAVRDAGPARTAVLVGTAPLASVALAIAWLDEPVRPALVLAAVLIVGGGILLAAERIRPETFRAVGALLALLAAALFGVRDNVIRRLAIDAATPPLAAAAATLVGGTAVVLAFLVVSKHDRPRRSALSVWLPAGLLFGLSYAAMFGAYYRGRVTVVSPLIATESLWAVVFSALVLGRSEPVGRHLLAGAALIVAGGALIGATR